MAAFTCIHRVQVDSQAALNILRPLLQFSCERLRPCRRCPIRRYKSESGLDDLFCTCPSVVCGFSACCQLWAAPQSSSRRTRMSSAMIRTANPRSNWRWSGVTVCCCYFNMQIWPSRDLRNHALCLILCNCHPCQSDLNWLHAKYFERGR